MVTGSEYIFDNIDEALKYVLETEQWQLTQDAKRKAPPAVFRAMPNMFSQPYTDEMARQAIVPVDSLDYPQSAWFNNAADDKFVMTRLNSGRYSLKPNLRHRKFLFRGESEFHNPCKPNLSRNPHQRRFTAELIRGQEMKILMMSHPLVQLLDLGVELCGMVYRFEMNLFGLTQHYYNKTSFLDLTSDPQVAVFFATTKYDWKTDTYSPIEDEDSKPGVLYYYSLNIDEDFGVQNDGRRSPLSTIGLQVFPRSGRQRGFLYDLRPNENFNDVARVNAVRFRHKADIARPIYTQYGGGRKLFPDDILMQHWNRENKDKDIISNRTVLMNKIDNPKMTLEEVQAEVRGLGFDIQDYVPRFTQDELDQYYALVKNDNFWEKFCIQIHIPGDQDGKMMSALLSLPDDSRYKWAFERDNSHVTDYGKGYVMNVYKDCLR
jgi:hypothetical protein